MVLIIRRLKCAHAQVPGAEADMNQSLSETKKYTYNNSARIISNRRPTFRALLVTVLLFKDIINFKQSIDLYQFCFQTLTTALFTFCIHSCFQSATETPGKALERVTVDLAFVLAGARTSLYSSWDFTSGT